MAHKTLINGTSYEISGGKTLVGGTAYNISGGKTLVGGTVYEVSFSGWADDLDTGLEFISASPFTIAVNFPRWDGTMEYCNGDEGWKIWDGSEISSGKTGGGQCIYIRGTGNTMVIGGYSSSYCWTLTGTNIECNGNIEKLLDYATVLVGEHPNMAIYCYAGMFGDCTSLVTAPNLPATTLATYCYYFMFNNCTNLITAPSLPATTLAASCYNGMFTNCTNLITAPSLPATTLAASCYGGMFRDCTSLVTAPNLPATTLATYCYYGMFRGCTSLTTVPSLPATTLRGSCYYEMFLKCIKIKVSFTETDTYTKAYRIPHSGIGTNATDCCYQMFNETGGTFKGTPSINRTYYLDESNTIV